MLRVVHLTLGLLALLKAIDIAWRLPDHAGTVLSLSMPDRAGVVVAWGLVGAWVTGGLLLSSHRSPRVGAAILAASGAVMGFAGLYNHHLYLMIVVASVLAAFAEQRQLMLIRVQLTVVYSFAALAKINGIYLSGITIEQSLDRSLLLSSLSLPNGLLVAVAIASVAAEGGIAAALWFRRTRVAAAVVGVTFHAAMVVGMAYGVLGTVRLVVYSGVVVSMYVAFFEDKARVQEREVPKALSVQP